MEYKEALDIIGGLSKPSKMPWRSWSIPAQACKTGSLLRKKNGSVCGKCYAMKGMYSFPNVKAALNRRLKAIDHPLFVEAFSLVLNKLVGKSRKKENRFRWHDSGDIQSVEHLDLINRIALSTPLVRHWLPTKEAGILNKWNKANPQGVAKNLTIRQSYPMIGGSFEEYHIPYSTVGYQGKDVVQCNSYDNNGKCGACDLCWRRDVKGVNYRAH